MKVTSKSLYKEIRLCLGDKMKQAGFKSARGGRLGWTRPASSGHLTVWFQSDKWGWDDAWGSKFTVEFVLAPDSGSWIDPANGRFERLGYLLEGFEEIEELRVINNRVIRSLPGTKEHKAQTMIVDGELCVLEGVLEDSTPASLGHDLWLSYYSPDDVRMWGAYFAKNLLEFIDRFEHERRSALGEARANFDNVMSKVQASESIDEKIELLETFAASGTSPEFVQSAGQWLGELYSRR